MSQFQRSAARTANQLRPVRITRGYTCLLYTLTLPTKRIV